MSASKQISLSGLPRGELEALAERLLAENDALRQVIAGLKAEVATLKGVRGRPKLKPSGMNERTEPAPAESRGRGAKASKAGRLPIDEERVIAAEVPAGSRFKGYEDFLVQDLVLRPHVVRLRRERWLTPDGRTVTAPMPAGIVGHFGPALRRFVLAQYHQGQVTVPRLVAQLRAIGILISKRQVVRLLNAGRDAFLDEAREVLRAGLSAAGWVSVDDTGRHRGEHGPAVGREPALAADPYDVRAEHQVLDQEVLVALEPRAGGDVRLDDALLVDGEPVSLAPATASPVRGTRLGPGALLHAAGLHLGAALHALERRDLGLQLGDRLLQGVVLGQQPFGQGLQLTARQA